MKKAGTRGRATGSTDDQDKRRGPLGYAVLPASEAASGSASTAQQDLGPRALAVSPRIPPVVGSE